MIKKASILALVAYLSLAGLSPGLVHAQGGPTILDSSVQVDFPSKLSFSLSAENEVNIIDIRLHYTVDRVSLAQVTSEVYIEFVPAITVDAEWVWDMRKTGGLPPGSSVEYWWTVEDAKGDRVETAPVRVWFDDTRYSWHSLTKDKVAIFWYEGDESFARELMAAVHQALARLAEDTSVYLEEPVRIYIYADAEDLKGATIYPQEWVGGLAFVRYGIIAIGIAPNELVWGKRAMVHELTHLVIHQMTINPYNDLPTWLDEGLAIYTEGPLESVFASSLNRAIAEDSLTSVRSLSSPFSAYIEESRLSYAQSYSLVEFLTANYGRGKMLELLNTFKQGSSYDGALEQVYGFDMDSLDALWRNYVAGQDKSTEVAVPVIPTPLIGVLVGLATVLLLILGLAAERWAWRRGW